MTIYDFRIFHHSTNTTDIYIASAVISCGGNLTTDCQILHRGLFQITEKTDITDIYSFLERHIGNRVAVTGKGSFKRFFRVSVIAYRYPVLSKTRANTGRFS